MPDLIDDEALTSQETMLLITLLQYKKDGKEGLPLPYNIKNARGESTTFTTLSSLARRGFATYVKVPTPSDDAEDYYGFFTRSFSITPQGVGVLVRAVAEMKYVVACANKVYAMKYLADRPQPAAEVK